MKLTDEQEKQIIKAAVASTMTEEQKALGAFLGAMHDCKLDGKKMREAMLGILGITGDGRGEALSVNDEIQVLTAERDFWKQKCSIVAATMAGLESAVGHLSRLFDEQRELLVEVEAVFGVDGHYGPFEDGECPLIDLVRAHLIATNAPYAPPQQEQASIQEQHDKIMGKT